MPCEMFVPLILFVVFGVEASAQFDADNTRVINGKDARLGQFPWQVLILKDGRTQCGGSILDATTILSAAHCYNGGSLSQYSIVFGTIYKTNYPSTLIRTVSALRRHKSFRSVTTETTLSLVDKSMLTYFDNGTFSPELAGKLQFDIGLLDNAFKILNNGVGNDIMILKLSKPMTLNSNAKAAVLPYSITDAPSVGLTCTVSGWGYSKKSTSRLLFANVDVKSNSYCHNVYSSKMQSRIYSTQICSGGEATNNACFGDSGGPMQCHRNGKHVLDGIVSWGPNPCGQIGIPGVYTRISSFLDWIQQNRY